MWSLSSSLHHLPHHQMQLLLVSSLSFITLVTPGTVAHQDPLSMGFPRQEYWRGLPFPPSGDRSNPGMEPHVSCGSCIADGFFATEPLKKPRSKFCSSQNTQKGTLGHEHQPCKWILLEGQKSGKNTASSLISPKPHLLIKFMLRRKHVQEYSPIPRPLRLSAVLLAREKSGVEGSIGWPWEATRKPGGKDTKSG